MCGPAGGPGDRKDRSEHVGRKAERVVDGGRVEIDIGIQPLALLHELGDALRHADPLALSKLLAELNGHGTEVGGTRIEGLVDAVTDAHDLLLGGERSLNPTVDLGLVADLLKHVDDSLVGAAVKGSLERADGGGHGRVDVAQRGDRDARGEGGGIHAVIGMEDVGDVEGLCGLGGRHLSVEEIEEVGGLTEVGADGGELLAKAGAVIVRGDDADFGGQGDGAVAVLDGIDLAGRHLVVEAEHGDTRADDIHGVGILGGRLEEVDDALREFALGTKLLMQCLKLGLVGKFPVPEEVDDLLVADLAG